MSFITPSVANKFEILTEKLCEPFCVSALVGESVLAERVIVIVLFPSIKKNHMDDLVELDMVDLYVILGMD